jgi:multifunctional beta-oxidation protein
LHGEQHLLLKKPLQTEGRVINQSRLLEVLDKGKAASLTFAVETRDADTKELLLEGSSTLFARGAGGVGDRSRNAGELFRAHGSSLSNILRPDRGFATAAHKPPDRAPDRIVELKTSPRQAALYRLSGDYNPLHVDPGSAK